MESGSEKLERETREDIVELTGMMRNSPMWRDFRAEIASQGYDAGSLLLVHLIESEEADEYGVLVSSDSRVVRFVREPVPGDLGGRMRLREVRDITDNDLMRKEFASQQVKVALRMVEEA